MRVEVNLPLEDYNSYRVKSSVALAFFPDSIDELHDCIGQYPDAIIWGGGNNIILSKKHYTTPIIFIRDNLKSYHIEGNMVEVNAGMQMSELSDILLEQKLTGFETFCDIPGCIGGGIIMNAGSGNDHISDCLISVKALDKKTNTIVQFSRSSCVFDYRESIFKKKKTYIITSAEFSFKKGEYNSIKGKMDEIRRTRHSKQPREYPNAGSVFKRPDGYYVGAIIENLGLCGYSVGGAQVSEKHAGFIVNTGNATGEDILNLISYIQVQVHNKLNINLQLEQIII
ncbi:MAG: UDP-N-acetylmuramate dehydrogenase [Ignavibacteriaceae bacterium]|jgi:UDP-N-acetylmuramate dehydrogenase|nr:UDP-N-acetylmuramate dehydrogenase [Ignavibacteriaceae bacterium]